MFLGWLATSHGGSKIMMPGEILESNEVENIILANDLTMVAQRKNRDTSDYLDDNLEPIPFPSTQQVVDLRQGEGEGDIPGGIVPPADIPEGFDPSTLEPQEDGQFCVFKTIPVEGL